MNWFIKSLIFKAFSTVPGGAALYRHAQWNWTKSIVATPARVGQKIDVGMSYLSWLLDHGRSIDEIRSLRHLDLGAGWHPTIPLLFSKIGMRHQVLTDVCPLMTADTFLDALKLTDQLVIETNGHPARPLLANDALSSPPHGADLETLLASFQMEYQAPYFEWAAKPGHDIDLATCTQVLMHITRPILDDCFKLIHNVLKPGGLFMAPVHLFDIYSNSDPKIGIYNHLRYSRHFWRTIVSSEMMTFNRLKSPDYRDALIAAGFEILEFVVDHGNAEELRGLRALNIHPEFSSRYSERELSEKHLFFVARKP
ncbi:MAG: class I SAM-dependent methyltransferase [Verrucomicrobiota bacterium]